MLENTQNRETTPWVSIGLPVYNGEVSLQKTIESVIGQTHRNFELIISDNASTDRTAEICQKFASLDTRIRYVRQDKNIGASCNFRYVLEAARHERFIWVAADDWWDADRLETLVRNLQPQDAVVVGEIRRWLGQHLVAKFVPMGFQKKAYLRFFFREHSRCEKVYYIYGLMWREMALKSISVLDDKYAADAIFCYRLLTFGNLKSVAGAGLNVLIHKGSSGSVQANEFRYSVSRLLYRAHPWDYYSRYYKASTGLSGIAILLSIPFNVLGSQLHLWFRAFHRVLFRRPYMHGVVDDGAKRLSDNGF